MVIACIGDRRWSVRGREQPLACNYTRGDPFGSVARVQRFSRVATFASLIVKLRPFLLRLYVGLSVTRIIFHGVIRHRAVLEARSCRLVC